MADSFDNDMQDEYDLEAMGPGVRGKYFDQYQDGTNLVRLDADLQKHFPDSEAVNFALRHLMQVMEHRNHSA